MRKYRQDKEYDPEQLRKGTEHELDDKHTKSRVEAERIAKDHLDDDPEYYSKLEKFDLDEKKKRKKAGSESSKESSLRDWFKRKGAKGKKGGWVDCNAPDGKGGYKSCGRSSGEKRKKYPACRPTPGACKERGRGKSWGKKGSKKKRNENMQLTTEQIKKIIQEELANVLMESDVIMGIEKIESLMFNPKVDEEMREQYRNQFRELISSGVPEVTEWANARIAEIDKEIKPLRAEIEKLFTAAASDDYDALQSGMEAQDMVDFELRPLLDKKKLYQPMSLQEKKGSKRQRKKKAKKDACYHKVRSRYDVWPSAYASGALVKCRKVGAKNWGNKSKKNEEVTPEEEEELNDISKELGKASKMHKGQSDRIKKVLKNESISESLRYHQKHNAGVEKNVFRPGSQAFFRLFREARQLFQEGRYKVNTFEEKEILESDLGEFGMFGEQMVPLDFPMVMEQDEMEFLDEKKKKKKKKKDPPIGKPTKNSGGGKKYKVFVRNPKTGKIKKITYGDSKGGLKGNWNSAEARKSFASRHNCKDKKDRTKAGYWACRAHKDFGKNVPGRFW